MRKLVIQPGVGIGPILLGDTRADVRAALEKFGFPLCYSRETLDYFAKNAIQVEFSDDERAEFIGIAYGDDYEVIYRDVNVFDIEAPKLFKLIAAQDNSGPHTYVRNEYLFPNQIMTLWEADKQYDKISWGKRMIWAQVGLGNKDYLAAIQRQRTES